MRRALTRQFRLVRLRVLRIVAVFTAAATLLSITIRHESCAAQEAYEAIPFTFEGEIAACLHGDIDHDGDQDLAVIQRSAAAPEPRCILNFIRQVAPGRFDYPGRQTFLLPNTGALYDLADVSGGSELELVELRVDGVYQYALRGVAFLSEPSRLIEFKEPATFPRELESRAHDFAWALIPDAKECLAVPYASTIDLWVADDSGRFAIGSTLPCGVISGGAGMRYDLPRPHEGPTPATLELFLRSGDRWYGLRRSGPQSLDFQQRVVFEDHEATAQIFSLGDVFKSGSRVRDLNHDGTIDVVRWRNVGGVSRPACVIEVCFGPFNQLLPASPHAEINIEGVVGYPEFADLNGDRRKDLVVCAVEVGTLAMAKSFVIKKVSPYLLAYRQRPDNSFSIAPDARLKFDHRLDLDRPDPAPRPLIWVIGDTNGNGCDEIGIQNGSDRLQIHRPADRDLLPEDFDRVACPNASSIEVLDLNGDARSDLILWHDAASKEQSLTLLLAR